MKKLFYLITTISLTAAIFSSCTEQSSSLTSPDGRIEVSLGLKESGSPYYQVKVGGRDFITESWLGHQEKEHNLMNGYKVRKWKSGSTDEVWHQPWGENKDIRSNYNERAMYLVNDEGVNLTIRFKVFNDGFGFRYEYDVPADSLNITDEITEFNISDKGDSWSIPANFDTYELIYKAQPLVEVRNANTPMTFKTNSGIYASIHEANLTDYPEMTLQNVSTNTQSTGVRFKADLAHWPDGIRAKFNSGKFVTPWRTVQIADKATGLINSALILNLNEPCKLEGDLSWIKPMKYVGIWWGMHLGVQSWVINDRHGATTENTKKYIDFAAANNIEGVLIEGWNQGWETWGRPGFVPFNYTKPYADFDIDEVCRYAKEKGVEILGHHETGGDIPNYEAQLENAFEWTKAKGINHVKTGYAGGIPGGHQRHEQYTVRHYRKVIETAAKYHLTINAHEPIKATGLRRTYPNSMSREGARGMEWNAWSEGNPVDHHEMLPFTRLLAGPMDFTPGTFDILLEKSKHSPDRKVWNSNDKGNSRVNTTLAKQIASWVTLYSPVQMASDMIENYEGHPAFQFFRDFDADCDWSEALQGEPGEFVAIVRRAKDRFFLGSTTAQKARTLTIPLDFLKEGITYDAVQYCDGDDADWKTNPTSYKIIKSKVTSADTLKVHMASGGGQAVSFIPEK